MRDTKIGLAVITSILAVASFIYSLFFDLSNLLIGMYLTIAIVIIFFNIFSSVFKKVLNRFVYKNLDDKIRNVVSEHNVSKKKFLRRLVSSFSKFIVGIYGGILWPSDILYGITLPFVDKRFNNTTTFSRNHDMIRGRLVANPSIFYQYGFILILVWLLNLSFFRNYIEIQIVVLVLLLFSFLVLMLFLVKKDFIEAFKNSKYNVYFFSIVIILLSLLILGYSISAIEVNYKISEITYQSTYKNIKDVVFMRWLREIYYSADISQVIVNVTSFSAIQALKAFYGVVFYFTLGKSVWNINKFKRNDENYRILALAYLRQNKFEESKKWLLKTEKKDSVYDIVYSLIEVCVNDLDNAYLTIDKVINSHSDLEETTKIEKHLIFLSLLSKAKVVLSDRVALSIIKNTINENVLDDLKMFEFIGAVKLYSEITFIQIFNLIENNLDVNSFIVTYGGLANDYIWSNEKDSSGIDLKDYVDSLLDMEYRTDINIHKRIIALLYRKLNEFATHDNNESGNDYILKDLVEKLWIFYRILVSGNEKTGTLIVVGLLNLMNGILREKENTLYEEFHHLAGLIKNAIYDREDELLGNKENYDKLTENIVKTIAS